MTIRNKNKKNRAGFLGEELLGPQASLRVIPCSQTQISTYRSGERSFGPQASLRMTSVQQCHSNPRPPATSAVSVARHIYRSATLKSLGNISINS